jgi:hypothetical protein
MASRKRWFLAALVTAIVASAVASLGYMARRGDPRATAAPPEVSEPRRPFEAEAVALRQGGETYVCVVALPEEGPALAVTLPGDLAVDIPGGGPETLATAAVDPELLVAATQSALGRIVRSALLLEEEDMAGLIDRLGGIPAVVESEMAAAAAGAGSVRLSGSEAIAHLRGAEGVDRAGRWGQILTGLLATGADPARWQASLGGSAGAVGGRLAEALGRARGAEAIELATVVDDFGIRRVDRDALEELESRLGSGGNPVRVVVLNGAGRAGVALELTRRLAGEGFWVVAAQNAGNFGESETTVVAGQERYLRMAERARAIIGVGKVYVGVQPTGIADVTIVVGKDFEEG